MAILGLIAWVQWYPLYEVRMTFQAMSGTLYVRYLQEIRRVMKPGATIEHIEEGMYVSFHHACNHLCLFRRNIS